jgi:co-chaperonin GroES (HSP10)
MMMTDLLPQPTGWKILIQKKKPKEKTAGGIILSDISKDNESYLSICAQVIRIGSLCWHDRETGKPWQGGPWCKEGDWVIVPKFTALRLEIKEEEYRFINDDEIIAVVEDPTAIKVYS